MDCRLRWRREERRREASGKLTAGLGTEPRKKVRETYKQTMY
jgi:hypothetical protein